MGLLNSLRKRVARAILPTDLRETVDQAIPLLGEFTDKDENLFRRLDDKAIRELSASRRQRQLRLAYFLYLFYPVAYRGMEITRDFIVGEGINFEATEPKVQEVLNDVWFDPVNRWDLKQYPRALELGLYGEQFYSVAVNKENGRVQMGYIDPLEVLKVRTDPDNVEIATEIVLGRAYKPGTVPDVSEPTQEPVVSTFRALDVVRISEEDDPKHPLQKGRLKGEVFFFAINKVSNATRGNSDLLPAVDWIELHEQFLLKMHEAADIKTSVCWDVLVKGADEDTLERMRQKFGDIKSGTSWWHNESMELKERRPELQTADLAEHAQVLKGHIATALGLPLSWLSDPGDTSGATAGEMGMPTVKRLRSRQRYFVNMIRFIFEFVIDQAKIAGRLPEDIDRSFSVFAPQIWAIDTQRITSSLVTGAQALMLAEQNGWITNAEAAKTFRFIADQLGISLSSIRAKSGEEKFDSTGDEREDWFDRIQKARLADMGQKFANAAQGRPRGPTDNVPEPVAGTTS